MIHSDADAFVADVVHVARNSKITFDVLGGFDNGHVCFQTSDIDVLCLDDSDVSEFVWIILDQIGSHKGINIVTKRSSVAGQQVICSSGPNIFMFDVLGSMRYENLTLLDSEVYFELIDNGIDAKAIARFVKDKTQFKRAWPGVPNRIYSFRKRNVRCVDKWLYRARKLVTSCFSFLHQSNGIFVVVLGPDGSGKSSVIQGVVERLCGERTIIPVFRFHWRPFLRRRREVFAVKDPHGMPLRSAVISIVKIFYLLVIFNLGYIMRVARLLHRGCIVVFDRYYHDLLIDPVRYRYGAPMWLAKLVGGLIPSPELWILLDAPAELLQKRKKEVTINETLRQRAEYLKMVGGLTNSVVVDTSRPLNEVVSEVTRVIVDAMTKKTIALSKMKNSGFRGV